MGALACTGFELGKQRSRVQRRGRGVRVWCLCDFHMHVCRWRLWSLAFLACLLACGGGGIMRLFMCTSAGVPALRSYMVGWVGACVGGSRYDVPGRRLVAHRLVVHLHGER